MPRSGRLVALALLMPSAALFSGGSEETMLRMNATGKAIPGVCDDNAYRVFRFIGLNQHHCLLFKRTLETQSAIPDRPVELDPFGACRNCGIS